MLVFVLSLLAVAAAEEMVVLSGPAIEPSLDVKPADSALAAIPRGYHGEFGIPTAESIRQAESRPGGRVAGSVNSYLGEHKFFAGLLITLTTGQTSVCGGSLVSSSRVLTSASCWYDGTYQGRAVQVVLGSVYLFSGGTRVSATAIAVHPNYNYYWLMNNLAVLWIPSVSSTSYIKPIALASSNLSYAGYTAEIIGFGKTSDNSAITSSQRLRDAFVPVITNDVCKQTYGILIEPEHICTSGASGRGACGGDQGGPLILYSSAGNDVLIGVVAFWSANGCSSLRPSGHTRVAHHLPWIRAQL